MVEVVVVVVEARSKRKRHHPHHHPHRLPPRLPTRDRPCLYRARRLSERDGPVTAKEGAFYDTFLQYTHTRRTSYKLDVSHKRLEPRHAGLTALDRHIGHEGLVKKARVGLVCDLCAVGLGIQPTHDARFGGYA